MVLSRFLVRIVFRLAFLIGVLILLILAVGTLVGGNVLAYTANLSGNFDVFILDPVRRLYINLTRSPNSEFDPAWSPDGQIIAYHTDDSRDANIYFINVYTRALLQLTGDPSLEASPAWSPDGQRIAFEAYGTGDWEIVSARKTGSDWGDWGGLFNLTRTEGADGDPRWSPDGQWIAFTSRRANDPNPKIYVMDTSGGQHRRLGDDSPSADRAPAWSPDGTQLVFISSRIEGEGLYVINADGTNLHPLEGTKGGGAPAWSPDGQQIAFTRGSDLYTLELASNNITQLTYTRYYELSPAWKP